MYDSASSSSGGAGTTMSFAALDITEKTNMLSEESNEEGKEVGRTQDETNPLNARDTSSFGLWNS
eukprot:CAMPEP_0183717188 /NCGR_PEP_ID=MMETSP0737-20130205/10872_1 /TAXON_ID=385413 /ORGANISM="Thalassiosira miniscula, Strain CCMP1093" /LENGTH=64 /DNA_ID=CAMNT_0025946579 /DNA_START=194 /DNA_END=385 /DNA_ORIENTATION=+